MFPTARSTRFGIVSPLKHRLSYVERWVSPSTGGARALGTAWHTVQEAHYRELMAIQAELREAGASPDGHPWSRWQYPEGTAERIHQAIHNTDVFAGEHAEIIAWMYQGYLCQPAGTRVRLTDRTEQPIEDIRPGDRVLSWRKRQHGRGWIRKMGSRVADVGRRWYDGDLVSVQTPSQLVSEYTADHLCIAVAAGGFERGWVVYVMCKDGQYRVGHTQSRRPGNQSHLSKTGIINRAHAEKSDAVWVLGVYATKREAWLAELTIAQEHNLPTLSFAPLRAFPVAEFWLKVGHNHGPAARCLRAHGRDIRYPLWERGDPLSHWADSAQSIRACNLMDGMRVLAVDQIWPTHRGDLITSYHSKAWQPIEVSRRLFAGWTYSLQVDNDETYIADGILTHNCRWGLRTDWTILAVEFNPVSWLPDETGQPSRFDLKCKLDLVIQETGSGLIWLVDHKSGQRRPNVTALNLADQFGLYTWMLRRLGRQVHGALHSWAKTTQPKQVDDLKDRFQDFPMDRSDTELDTIAADAYRTVSRAYADVEADLVPGVYPDGEWCRRRCDFVNAHLAFRRGFTTIQAYLADTGFEQNFERH